MHGTHALTAHSTARRYQRDTQQLRYALAVCFDSMLHKEWTEVYQECPVLCLVAHTCMIRK